MFNKIKIEVISGLYNNFINYLIQQEFYISSIKRTDFGVTLFCMASDYKTIAKTASKFQCKTKILEKRGLYFKISKNILRKGVIAGAITVMFYIFMFGKLIWRVDIISTNEQINQDINSLLYKNDIYVGAIFDKEKNQDIIQQIFMEVENVGYVTLNFYKGILVCKTDPAINKMPYLKTSVQGNITATHNGVIEDLRIYSGFPMVKTGQTVLKGDILVSSTYIDKNGTLQQVMPRAYIKANCVKSYISQVDLTKDIYIKNGIVNEQKILKILNKKFLLKKAKLNDFEFYDTECVFQPIQFLGFRFPATLEKTKYYKKELVHINNNEQTAYDIAKRNVDAIIENDIALEQVTDRQYSYYLQGNTLTVICDIQGKYDITK